MTTVRVLLVIGLAWCIVSMAAATGYACWRRRRRNRNHRLFNEPL